MQRFSFCFIHRDSKECIYKTNSSECVIHDEPRRETYKQNILDLEGATCLASYQGWLLVFKDKSIFFFCPFSLAKIALPDFPHNQIEGHIAAFSDLPTSPNCIVAVLNATYDRTFEINMISKGQSEWTQHIISGHNLALSSNVTAATFDHGRKNFDYMDDRKYILSFSTINKIWTRYTILKNTDVDRGDTEDLPYRLWSRYLSNTIDQMRDKLDIEDDEYVVVCGLTFHHPVHDFPAVYQNEVVDSSTTKTRMRRAVWIQPRFFEAHPNQHW